MDVITALIHVMDDEAVAKLRSELIARPVDVDALKNGLEDIAQGDFPAAVQAVVLPQLIALRDVKSFGVGSFGTFKKPEGD